MWFATSTYVDVSTYGGEQICANSNVSTFETTSAYVGAVKYDNLPVYDYPQVVQHMSHGDDYNDLQGKGRMCSLSKTPYGSVRIQSMLKDDNVTADVKSALVSDFRDHVWAAMRSRHANHVLTCALGNLPPSETRFIVDEMLQGVNKAAKHQFGIRVLQRILEFGEAEKAEILVDCLFADAVELCKHEYGIRIMQHLTEHAPKGSLLHVQSGRLARILLENLSDFATDRWAPAVILKILTTGGLEARDAMIQAFLSTPDLLATMACEPKRGFGYEAAEEALKQANPDDKWVVLQEFSGKEQSECFEKSGRYGKRFRKLIQELKAKLESDPDSEVNQGATTQMYRSV
jgi:hypothetical protein